jgi:hypothetical protein
MPLAITGRADMTNSAELREALFPEDGNRMGKMTGKEREIARY